MGAQGHMSLRLPSASHLSFQPARPMHSAKVPSPAVRSAELFQEEHQAVLEPPQSSSCQGHGAALPIFQGLQVSWPLSRLCVKSNIGILTLHPVSFLKSLTSLGNILVDCFAYQLFHHGLRGKSELLFKNKPR